MRSDHNVLIRGNSVSLTDAGWVHAQRNEKLVKTTGEVLAVEEGANAYLRTDSKRCEPAGTWWVDNGPAWREIQTMWDHVRGHHPDMKFKARVDGKLLWERLFEIADEAVAQAIWESKDLFKKPVHDVIHDYFE